MKNQGSPEEWLRRANSNLNIARAGQISEDVLYEDLCFQCQQTVEKALKGLLIALGKTFPYTHNVNSLVNPLKEAGLALPDFVCSSATLTVYAGPARYPSDQEPVGYVEYRESLNLAEQVYEWVSNKLKE